jgi:hypothetical protein
MDLLDLNLIGDFYRVNILPREASGEVVANKRSYEAQKSLGGMAHQEGHATSARLALEHRLASVFLCTSSFRKKGMPYFFHNFLMQRQRLNPSSTSERADLLLPPEGNCRHRHDRLLLGAGGSISITSIAPSSSSPTSAPSPPHSLW